MGDENILNLEEASEDWRMLQDEGLDNLFYLENIIIVIKLKMGLHGRAEKYIYTVSVKTHEGKGKLGKPRRSCNVRIIFICMFKKQK
jgi:hypothetical protein